MNCCSRLQPPVALASFVVLVGCTSTPDGTSPFGGTETSGVTSTAARSDSSAANSSTGQQANSETFTPDTATTVNGTSDDGTPRLDVGSVADRCGIQPDGDGITPCDYQAPPDSFAIDVQWSWTLDPDGHRTASSTLPLVANLTDDNEDGRIDLCDTPDIVVSVYDPDHDDRGLSLSETSFFYILDGATGQVHARSQLPIHVLAEPALGDIDADGVPEILALVANEGSSEYFVAAFEADGSHKWTSTSAMTMASGNGAATPSIGLADFDNDGDVEIYSAIWVYDHQGNLLWTAPEFAPSHASPVAVDLDGDGDLELVTGAAAYHHNGTRAWMSPVQASPYPQIANLDDDEDPEVVIATSPLTILEHDGVTSPISIAGNWSRPITLHDIDGDTRPNIVAITASSFHVFDHLGVQTWSVNVSDLSGPSGGTAFDFLGDGTAEAMYADEDWMYAFGPGGSELLRVEHVSSTGLEYPVVADVDNDGAAEIVVVSDRGWDGSGNTPTVQVVRDVNDRWVPARRIWNQHTYHVTNINEDGTIPAFEAPHWRRLNTFRTQAQVTAGGGGATCHPEG